MPRSFGIGRAVDVGVEKSDLRPSECSPSARLTAVVDLPTPPLPDATAITCATPGIRCVLGCLAPVGRGCGLGACGSVRLPVPPSGWRRRPLRRAGRGPPFRPPGGRFHGGGLRRIDEDREHHAAARIDHDVRKAAGLHQLRACPASTATSASACITCSRVIATMGLLAPNVCYSALMYSACGPLTA